MAKDPDKTGVRRWTIEEALAIGPSVASRRQWTAEEIEAAAAADPSAPTSEQLARARPAAEVMRELTGDPDYAVSKLIFEADEGATKHGGPERADTPHP